MIDRRAEQAKPCEVRNRYLEAVENHRRVWDQHQQGLASSLALIEAQEAEEAALRDYQRVIWDAVELESKSAGAT